MIPLSILDLSLVTEGSTPAQALRNSLDVARHAERLGFKRYWMAEHHNMVGIASAATSVALGYVAAGTSTIRIGAGGVMLPNHAPLVIAEQFGTLATLYPGRVDLGVGRAPGTDQPTAHALRRTLVGDEDRFPQDVMELLSYFDPVQPGQRVQAVPGAGLSVPVWILGSSLFGAQLAAALGLPFAFASHFAPDHMMAAIQIYRDRFRASDYGNKPYIMLGLNVVAADTDEAADLLYTSYQQAFINLRSGRPGRMPPPDPDFNARVSPQQRSMLDHVLLSTVKGSPASIRAGLNAFIARTGADEVIITSPIFDHTARVQSIELVAEVRGRVLAA